MKAPLYLLLLLLPICLYSEGAQNKISKYRSGGIISLNNDTIYAKIKFEPIYNLQDEIKYIDAGGKKKTLKPDRANGFFFDTDDGKIIFESRKDIRISAFPSKNGYFVYRISNDIYPLYYFVLCKMVNIGVELSTVQVPYYLIRKNFEWHIIRVENFKDCVEIFMEYDVLVKDIKNNKYTFDDVPKITERYCQLVKNETKNK